MAVNPIDLRLWVEEFQYDLQHMDLVKVIRKHITTGPSKILSHATYYELRDDPPIAAGTGGSASAAVCRTANVNIAPHSQETNVN